MNETRYKPTLVKLMSFLDNVQYEKNHIFTAEQLGALTPNDVLRWMNVQTFGIPNPALDANRTLAWSNTIKYWKKALSHFMPNRLMPWNRLSNQGNPTKSTEILDLIKRVKKKEARKEGAPSHTRRPMSAREFRLSHNILANSNNNVYKFGIAALLNFQFHMIARIDDTTQVVLDHIRVNDSFNFALKAKLNWSKNVQEERDAPWQIVLGSMDPVFCVLVSLALWLKWSLLTNPTAAISPYVFAFSEDTTIPKGGQKSKELI
mmetsp:Transcript_26866/g.38107  ORF Transcript_26866/g.38107 Transcript_26866/m.38107 type:complete len:262 (+) Transcript_26866:298-1083(+)